MHDFELVEHELLRERVKVVSHHENPENVQSPAEANKLIARM